MTIPPEMILELGKLAAPFVLAYIERRRVRRGQSLDAPPSEAEVSAALEELRADLKKIEIRDPGDLIDEAAESARS